MSQNLGPPYTPPGYPPGANFPPGAPGFGGFPPSMQPPRPREPRRYGILRAIVMAPFSPELWRDVGQRWKGIGLFFMLVLLILSWLPSMIKGGVGFSRWVKNDSGKLVDQIPPIQITKGVATVSATQPYRIIEPESGKTIAVLDTTGEITELPDDAMALLTATTLVVRSNDKIETHPLSKFPDFYVDAARVRSWLDSLSAWFVPGGMVLMVVFSLIGRLICMLILGAIGMGFMSMHNARLDYAASMRLAAIAMTPGILLWTILGLFPIPNMGCFMEIAGIAMAILYMNFVVKANGEPSSPYYPPGMPMMQ